MVEASTPMNTVSWTSCGRRPRVFDSQEWSGTRSVASSRRTRLRAAPLAGGRRTRDPESAASRTTSPSARPDDRPADPSPQPNSNPISAHHRLRSARLRQRASRSRRTTRRGRRLHRQWFEQSAMADLLGADDALVGKDTLYRCLDKILAHKEALFSHLRGRWQDLFGASFEVLLYDLTSTYFESPPPEDEADKRRHGYSRDKRGDCVQVVIALIVTPEGFPLAYEVLPGNTADSTTLRAFLHRIEAQYGRAQRIWVMDRGIPTEAVLSEMRQAEPPVSYLVGTPKGRLTRMEQTLVGQPWQTVRPGVEVKLLSEEQELYILAQSRARIDKERAMRTRQLKRLWKRLGELSAMQLSRDQLVMKLGAARAKSPAGWRLADVTVDPSAGTLRYPLKPTQPR